MHEDSLSPAHKAAIVLTSLEKSKAVEILRNLSPKSVQLITAEISALGEIEPEIQQQAFSELNQKLNKGFNPNGGEDVARSLLSDVVGDSEKVDRLLENAGHNKTQAFSSIVKVNGEDLANILSKEQPATAAIILAFMPPKKAAEVITYFDSDFREEIVVRLAQKRNADPKIVSRIEKIFVDKVVSLIHTTKDNEDNKLGGPQLIADLFQNVDRTIEEEMMGSIQNLSQELADEIRDLMFTFDDVMQLSDQDIQKILREIPMDKLVIALKGVNDGLKNKFLNNLSKRAKENLLEEMELMGKLKLSDVESEQRNVIAIIRSLEAAGEISISAGGESDVYV